MKTSFWRRWLQSLRGTTLTGPVSRRTPRRALLELEALEDRVTPSLTPQLVLDIHPGPASALTEYSSQMVAIGSTSYFAADDGVHGVELWKSDGTVAGTTLVKDVIPGGYTGYYGDYHPRSSDPSNLTNVNGTLFFTVWSAGTGEQLWKSDGTEAGTVLVSGVTASNLTNVNGTLFFTAGGTFPGDDGYELWKSDGTTAGTVMVKDINPGMHQVYSYFTTPYYAPNSSYPGDLTNLNGTLFFTADDGVHGRELWTSDGTEAGTVLVKDVKPGSASSYLGNLTDVNERLFFSADDGTAGWELWTSDGTTAGTALVQDIRPGSVGSFPGSLTNVSGTLFFVADDATGYALWKSDGTAAGTTLVKDIDPGMHRQFGYSGPGYTYAPNASYFNNLTAVNGTLFFTANDEHGIELWTSDGTEAGTTLVKDIDPGSHWVMYSRGPYVDPWWNEVLNSSSAGDLTNLNGTLFFTATDGVNGRELWTSDGTKAGTVLVTDIYPGGNGSSPLSLTNVNGTLFFAAYEDVHGYELWMLPDAASSPPIPTAGVNNVTVTEGNTGTRAAVFTVTLSAASTEPVTVAYATSNYSATAGSDYTALSGTLTIPAGQTTGTITVLVNGDRLGETNETFFVNLLGATNANIGDNQGVGTIVDDEPRISIGDATVTEGNIGTNAATFTVTLSVASDQPVTVAYATYDGSYATASDYQAASGTLTIPAGQTSGTITVLVTGDRVGEPNESFIVDLSSPTNATISDGQGVGIIVDDEPRISISDVTMSEGRKGKTTYFTFTVTLSAAYDQPVTMSFKTTDGTAATGNGDYVARSGTLTFAPGETTKTITITVKGDSKREANEYFYLDLFGLSSNALFTRNRGVGTILNDD